METLVLGMAASSSFLLALAASRLTLRLLFRAMLGKSSVSSGRLPG
jgi:hypothetical protein